MKENIKLMKINELSRVSRMEIQSSQCSTAAVKNLQNETMTSRLSEIEITKNICRLCGKSGSNYVPIFDEDDLLIAEKIGRCLPIIVLSTDDLPSHICSECLQSLNTSYNLIVTSIKTDSDLRRQLAEFREKPFIPISTNRKNDKQPNSEDTLATFAERLNSSAIYGPMICEMCCKKFLDMNDFDKHIETEHMSPWPCSLCDKSFETSAKLVSHKEQLHAGNVLICTGCRDAERLAHGLPSLAEMQNSRKQIKKVKRVVKRKPKECSATEKIPNEADISRNEITDKESTENQFTDKECTENQFTDKEFTENQFTDKESTENQFTEKDSTEKRTETKWLSMCDICKIAFGTDELLTAHQRIHQKKILHCYICQTDLASIHDLFVHKQKSHNIYKRVQLKFACDNCGRFFSNNWQWLSHQQKINCKRRSSSHTCKYCGNHFTTNFKLTRHLRKHREEMLKDPSATIYRCVACPKVFVDKEFFQKHRNVHDPEYSDKFKCEPCNRSFRDERRLREHQQSIHEGVKAHQCDICGKMFHRLSNMRAHRNKHSGRKCDHCDEVFETLRPLADHIRDVHDLEPNLKPTAKKRCSSDRFVCRYCGKKLASYQSLLDHEHIHTGEKPYPCKICDKSFRSNTARWAHTQRHVKGIFICEHCGKSFSIKQNLTTHVQVHVPIESRKHRCSKCGKLFTRKSHLNVHMRIHDGVRPFTCDICNFSFTQLGDMRRHRARHENGKIRTRQQQNKVVASSNEEDNQSETNTES